MSNRVAVLVLLMVISLTGCAGQIQDEQAQPPSDDPKEKGFTGYVVDRKEDSILVVSPEYEDFGSNGGASRYYPAKWFSNAPDPQVGSYVEIWTDGGPENEPYPGRARAESIAEYTAATPDGAKISEADAIRGGLYLPDGERISVPVIEDVEFQADTGTWKVRMRDAMAVDQDQSHVELEVRDVEPVEPVQEHESE
ncbi:DUF3221 domain-containing protein [Paenibacillus xylanilyticus]|uniref:DUF3221 domain-containing protein n=1 Tax=Paenibacillus xylanilyticus TaxID=248903 RepID=A0A7Y6BW55_9BACL|nr:DUF3221 domain-containing protein [Paenibacillus xylanilyticus]NUU76007.1 DUF3221 domain-containing protein [Paenibacillus xylanilyticus]